MNLQPFLFTLRPLFMLSFEDILLKLEKEIKYINFDYPPKSLYDPIEYILALGGKRIRPALALMACNIYKENVDDTLKPAIGMEVFHNFTLLHDDLMDKADKRRGKSTVHKVWNDNTAILSGDAMLIVAYKLIGETKPEHLKEILDLFTMTALEICGGQQYDMEFETRDDVEEAEYLEMIRLKTAVLLACCLKTGAILGGATKEDANHLYNFGINIGLAFQLQDDLLDVYGDPVTFGKNIGGDILCNKKTFLLINALKRSSEEQKDTLESLINQTNVNAEEKIKAVTTIYNDLDLKALTENKMIEYYNTAMKHLSSLQVPSEKLTILKNVCDRLMYRQS